MSFIGCSRNGVKNSLSRLRPWSGALKSVWSRRTVGGKANVDEYDSHSIPYMPVYCDLMKQERVSSLLLSTGSHETANRWHSVISLCRSLVGILANSKLTSSCDMRSHFSLFKIFECTKHQAGMSRRVSCDSRLGDYPFLLVVKNWKVLGLLMSNRASTILAQHRWSLIEKSVSRSSNLTARLQCGASSSQSKMHRLHACSFECRRVLQKFHDTLPPAILKNYFRERNQLKRLSALAEWKNFRH